ncbi:hypothetical protein BFS86_19385 [Shewanella algae]|jgi:hypothetical protein|nr:hypothetical protein BFS86_19385 [Shewanella algae]DAQ47182.1 MAG TPA: hypothetical protein [Caudoviricetes sp.]DAU40306.1 MAG TPA: hypothetical protein [Caudoviricetes sp.]
MEIIPLKPIPNQAVSVQLGQQNCQVNVYQKPTGLYIDLYVDNLLIIGGVIAENQNWIVRSAYLGFVGDLFFLDNQGSDDPNYMGLGGRFSLVYQGTT